MKFTTQTTTSYFTSKNQLELMKELVARPNAIFKSVDGNVSISSSFSSGVFSLSITSDDGIHVHNSLGVYASTSTEWEIVESKQLTLSEYLATEKPVVGEYCFFTDYGNVAVSALYGEFKPDTLRLLTAVRSEASYPYCAAGSVPTGFLYAIPARLLGAIHKGTTNA